MYIQHQRVLESDQPETGPSLAGRAPTVRIKDIKSIRVWPRKIVARNPLSSADAIAEVEPRSESEIGDFPSPGTVFVPPVRERKKKLLAVANR